MALQDVILGYAKGQKGDKGEKGETGAAGPIGPQGPAGNIADAEITDTQGIAGTAGQKTTAQRLFDAIANRAMNILVTNDALVSKLANYMLKSMMSNVQVNNTNMVPTSALLYAMQQELIKINGDLQTAYLLKGGTPIPAGADLKSDAYKVPGNYYVQLTSVVSSLLNLPAGITDAFTLKVEKGNGTDYPKQTFREYSSQKIVVRTFNSHDNTWTDGVSYVRNSDFRFDNINKYVLDWGDYGNGTHQLKSSIVGKTIYVSVGANGRITSFWGTSIVGDYRDVIIPDGVLSIHIDSETQITVSGATPEWMLRGIVTL